MRWQVSTAIGIEMQNMMREMTCGVLLSIRGGSRVERAMTMAMLVQVIGYQNLWCLGYLSCFREGLVCVNFPVSSCHYVHGFLALW